jgi:ribonuclease J
MNMTLIRVFGRTFFVDCGALFPDATHVGVNLILPSTNYIDEEQIHPEAWLITHGHEDHIGAMPHIFKRYPAPIYGTEFTIELIRAKFEDAGITDVTYRVWDFYKTTLFRNVKVTPFPVNHSIAQAAGLFIETPVGNVLHMGDFRIDYNPPEGTMTHHNVAKVLKNKPVHIMMSDSTNTFNEGTDNSESNTRHAIAQYFETEPGAVVVATFASNISRLDHVLQAARDKNRKVALLGRSMYRNSDIAARLHILNFPPDLIIDLEEAHRIPRNELCILCTGSQGEAFSGLHRLAFESLDAFDLKANDCVLFSSRMIPGNEKSIDALITKLIRMGCKVFTGKDDPQIHVSGHAYQEDLRTCILIAKPFSFLPVHGTYRHLKRHRELAIEAGVSPEMSFLAENGDVVLVEENTPVGVIDHVTSGRDYVCAGGIFSQNSPVYKERVQLAMTGVVVASFHVDPDSFELLQKPLVALKGIPLNDFELARKCGPIFEKVKGSLLQRKRTTRMSREEFKEQFKEDLRLAIRRHIENILNYKTAVIVML